MSTIKPFDGYLVNPERAAIVVSPPYDALTPQQRHEYATAHPRNYLNTMRSREEFPEHERPSLDELLAGNSAKLKQLIDNHDLVYQPAPGFYLYRLAVDGHVQTGLVAEVPVEEYQQGRVKKHENTQASKEDDLTAYNRVVRASSSPICLAYPASAEVDALIAELTGQDPAVDFVAEDGVSQTVWYVSEEGAMERLQELFEGVPATYLTDGHHRTASAVRFVEGERAANPNHTGEEPYNFLLVALFPDSELRILEYNRCVRGLNGHTVEQLVAAVEIGFDVERLSISSAEEARPRARAEMAMFVQGTWYRLSARPGVVPSGDRVRSLDVSVLQEQILGPTLGIDDPRTDPRISYMSGAFGLHDLEQHCRENDKIGFAVYPTSMEDLMAVADADEVMPAKSTWFDPKLRSGLFLRLR